MRKFSRIGRNWPFYLAGFLILAIIHFEAAGAAEKEKANQILLEEFRLFLSENFPKDHSSRLELNHVDGVYQDGDDFWFKVILEGRAQENGEDAKIFAYFDFYQLDGSVLHLGSKMHQSAMGHADTEEIVLGKSVEAPRYKLIEPFGGEILVVTLVRDPLFAEPRSGVENSHSYFAEWRTAIGAQLEAGSGPTFHFVEIMNQSSVQSSQVSPGTGTEPLPIDTEKKMIGADAPAEEPAPAEAVASIDGDDLIGDEGTTKSGDPAAEAAAVKATPSFDNLAPTGQLDLLLETPTAKEEEVDSGPGSTAFYKLEIAPRLKRFTEDAEDLDNLQKLSAAFKIHVVALAEQGNFKKAKQRLELAQALDPENSELQEAGMHLERLMNETKGSESAPED